MREERFAGAAEVQEEVGVQDVPERVVGGGEAAAAVWGGVLEAGLVLGRGVASHFLPCVSTSTRIERYPCRTRAHRTNGSRIHALTQNRRQLETRASTAKGDVECPGMRKACSQKLL